MPHHQAAACVARERFLAALAPTLLLFAVVAPPAVATGDAPGSLPDHTPRVDAFEHARIVTAPGRVIADGTLVIRDGVIVSVGAGSGGGRAAIPADAERHDLTGLTIYPGLIDAGASFGLPDTLLPSANGSRCFTVHPEADAATLFRGDARVEESYRKAGFTSALVTPAKGIFRGASALVSFSTAPLHDRLLMPRVFMGGGFDVAGNDSFPGSLMGSIALARQTLMDAAWYREAWRAYGARPAGQEAPDADVSLAALEPVVTGSLPLFWQASDEWNDLRAARVAKEAGARLVLLGSGFEFRRLDAVKTLGLPMVVPVNFPRRPDVSTPEKAEAISIRELRDFVLAPSNPRMLDSAGVRVAVTARGLASADDFPARMRRAIEAGWPADRALAALTTTPAEMLGAAATRGTLEPGKAADFMVTDGDLFAEKTLVRELWIGGRRIDVNPRPRFDPRGTWELAFANGARRRLRLGGTLDRPDGVLLRSAADTSGIKLTSLVPEPFSFSARFPGDSLGVKGTYQFTALAVGQALDGLWWAPDSGAVSFTGARTAPAAPAPPESATVKPTPPVLAPEFPEGAFGRPAMPPVEPVVLVRNATIWTEGPAGTIEGGDLLVKAGKIAAVGKGLTAPPGARVIDARGKHVTPGLIDCHSHIVTSGDVNEGTRAVSAMVRIGDVLDADDIAIYRQLAGGLTMSHPLHGSANPIGGQCELVKLRWGALPEELKMAGAPPTIKFALGENVKQSNWGDKYVTRYPQTRMGVEQVIRDALQRARDYQAAFARYTKAPRNTIPPRRDLELDALSDVLSGKLLVHCHAYEQDEMLMLMRVAEEFGFRIACFQHALEGYKIAEILKAHGAQASIFTDWWSYKFEVYDAIPYGGAILHDIGIVTSFNSDSSELARRLNLEAAKGEKYGGLSPEEALRFVTLNPAIQLRVDNRVGSLDPGKDADFVIWSGPPLSAAAHCEETWVDGRRMFDLDEDAALRRAAAAERRAIVQYVLALPEDAK